MTVPPFRGPSGPAGIGPWSPLLLALLAFPLLGQETYGVIARPGWKPSALALYEAGNKLFVFDDTSNTVFAFDATTLAEIGSTPLTFDAVYRDGMQVDESLGKLYVGCGCLGAGGLEYVAVIDAKTGSLLKTLETGGFTQLAKDEELDQMFASYNNGVSHIDVATDVITPVAGITGGNMFTSMSVNPVTHELFVSNWSQNGDVLYVVDGTTKAVTTVPDLAGFGVGVNWLENKAYVSYCKSAGLEGFCIYDRDGGGVVRFYASNDSSTAPVFNPRTNRMHTTVEVNSRTTIIEGATDQWFNVELDGANTRIAVRHATGNVYYAFLDRTAVMDGASARVHLELPVTGVSGGGITGDAAVNQAAGLVYVINDFSHGRVNVYRDFLFGDLDRNAVRDVFDVVVMASHIVGNVLPGEAPFLNIRSVADVDRDSLVDVFDLVVLQGFLVGNVPTLPSA